MRIRVSYSIPALDGWRLVREPSEEFPDGITLPVIAWGFADQTRVSIPLVAGEQPDLDDGGEWQLKYTRPLDGHVETYDIATLLTRW